MTAPATLPATACGWQRLPDRDWPTPLWPVAHAWERPDGSVHLAWVGVVPVVAVAVEARRLLDSGEAGS